MKKYLFVFGRDPELSYAELISYFKTFKIKYNLEYYKKNIAVFYINSNKININHLGGTVKIAEVILENKIKDSDFYLGNKNKINYAISFYNSARLLKKFEHTLKIWFKKQKIKALRKKTKTSDLSPRELNNLVEYIVCDRYIGRTTYVSSTPQYKKRDRERLHNDFLRSISIRFAKILINLSGAKEDKILLDPFCGVGVLLEEAVLRNIQFYGVEIDKKVSKMASENLRFFTKKHNLKSEFKIINGNSINLSRYFKNNFIDCVVTEPYLGPYFKKYPNKQQAIKVINRLNKLYEHFFINLRKVLKKEGKVAIVLPIIKASDKQKYKINMKIILRKTRFKITTLDNIRFPIIYKTNKSIIKREVYVLE